MHSIRIQDLRLAVGGQWLDGPPPGSSVASGVSTDTRTISQCDIFVALRGENHDGHRFLDAAAAGKAACAVIEAGVVESAPLCCIAVPDTTRALGDLARWYTLGNSTARRIAVAGSNGKTTTRTLTAAVLGAAGLTLQNEGNENNQVGVPKTLLRLDRTHAFAVIEIGTNCPGEIAYLTSVVRPEIGILTNIAEEHLEGLGSLAGVAEEEADLLRGLPHGGTAIMNNDDPLSQSLRAEARCGVVGSGFDARSQVRCTSMQATAQGSVFEVNGRHRFELPIPGRHNVQNALAAIATGWVCGVTVSAMQEALRSVRAAPMRSEVEVLGSVVLINDCYNANPGSMRAALGTVTELAGGGPCRVYLGDMLELGSHALAEHLALEEAVAAVDPELVVTVGPNMARLGDRLAARGLNVQQFADSASAAAAMEVLNGGIVLVKGSRGIRMERISNAIRDRLNPVSMAA